MMAYYGTSAGVFASRDADDPMTLYIHVHADTFRAFKRKLKVLANICDNRSDITFLRSGIGSSVCPVGHYS